MQACHAQSVPPRLRKVRAMAALLSGILLLGWSLSACSVVVKNRLDEPNRDAAVQQDGTNDDGGDAALPAPEIVTWKNEPGDSEPDIIRSAELFSVKTAGFDGDVDVVVSSDGSDASGLAAEITPDGDGWITFQVPTGIPAGPVHVTLRDSAHPDRSVSLPTENGTLTLVRWLLGLSGSDFLFWEIDQPGHLRSTNAMKIQDVCGGGWTDSDPRWVRIGDWHSPRQLGRWGFFGCPENKDIWAGKDRTRAVYLSLLGTSAPVVSEPWPNQNEETANGSFDWNVIFAPQGESGISVIESDPPNKLLGWHLTYETSGPIWNETHLSLFGPNGQTNFVPGGDQNLVGGTMTPTNKILMSTSTGSDGHVWFGEVTQDGVSLLGEVQSTDITPPGDHIVSGFWRQVPGSDHLLLGTFRTVDATGNPTTVVALMDADNNGEVLSRIDLEDAGLTVEPMDLVFSPHQPKLAVLLTNKEDQEDAPRAYVLRVEGNEVTAPANPLTAISDQFHVARAVWGQDDSHPTLLVWGWWPTGDIQDPRNPPDSAFLCRPNPNWTCTALSGGQVLWADTAPSDPGAFYVSTNEGLGKKKLRYCQSAQQPVTLEDCNELLTFTTIGIQAIAVQP